MWFAGTRLLQIGLLFVLVVSIAQVVWWYIDQNMHTSAVRARQIEHFDADVRAAEMLMQSGVSEERLTRLYPHLVVENGRAAVAPASLESMDEVRRKRLNQYRWEGGFFIVVLVACMAVLWRALREEALLRRRQQNFIAAVSHEFKSPLASLQLNVETMQLREPPPEKSKELLRRMLLDLRRMGEMVAKILDAARLEQGRIELVPEPVHLAGTVSTVLESFEARAQAAGVRLQADVPDEIEVQADPVAVRTVLSNLIDNAVKATTAAGGGKVKVEGARTDGHVCLTVEDDGLGFRPEERSKIFRKFYRPGDELRRNRPGAGLGLFIVKRFVALEKGRVQASSAGPGRGAKFTVSWPVAHGTGR
jgi:signal transduction histidine kinase